MIINKSCAFQLPFTLEMQKKNIFAFKKTSADRLRSIADSSRVAAEDRKITDTPNCAKKRPLA
jgi:hypothetical protein